MKRSKHVDKATLKQQSISSFFLKDKESKSAIEVSPKEETKHDIVSSKFCKPSHEKYINDCEGEAARGLVSKTAEDYVLVSAVTAKRKPNPTHEIGSTLSMGSYVDQSQKKKQIQSFCPDDSNVSGVETQISTLNVPVNKKRKRTPDITGSPDFIPATPEDKASIKNKKRFSLGSKANKVLSSKRSLSKQNENSTVSVKTDNEDNDALASILDTPSSDILSKQEAFDVNFQVKNEQKIEGSGSVEGLFPCSSVRKVNYKLQEQGSPNSSKVCIISPIKTSDDQVLRSILECISPEKTSSRKKGHKLPFSTHAVTENVPLCAKSVSECSKELKPQLPALNKTDCTLILAKPKDRLSKAEDKCVACRPHAPNSHCPLSTVSKCKEEIPKHSEHQNHPPSMSAFDICLSPQRRSPRKITESNAVSSMTKQELSGVSEDTALLAALAALSPTKEAYKTTAKQVSNSTISMDCSRRKSPRKCVNRDKVATLGKEELLDTSEDIALLAALAALSPTKGKQMHRAKLHAPKHTKPSENMESSLRRSPRKHAGSYIFSNLTKPEPAEESEDSALLAAFAALSPSKLTTGTSAQVVSKPTANNAISKTDLADLHAMFVDDHDEMVSLVGGSKTNLELNVARKCEVVTIEKVNPHREHILVLNCPQTGASASCRVRGYWLGCPLSEGVIVCIEAVKNGSEWLLDNDNGFLVLHPDLLLSGTTVVGSMFCPRRSVLSSMFRGIESDSSIMVIGSIVHELLQMVLAQRNRTLMEITQTSQQLLNSKHCMQMLYASNMTMAQIQKEVNGFIPKIASFVDKYVAMQLKPNKEKQGAWLAAPSKSIQNNKVTNQRSEEWNGKIIGVKDIEETLWDPCLGVKGMVDVSVEVQDSAGKVKLMPLELKTGKASFSAEHRGQVTLYTMMMSRVGLNVQSGLLLYLREGKMQEVACSHRERRDLILLRNNIANYLLPRAPIIDSETGSFAPQTLPEPISFRNACEKCPYLTLCSVYLKREGLSDLSSDHPMKSLSTSALEHLSDSHIDYVMRWVGMLQLEEMEHLRTSELRHIWSSAPDVREKAGKAIVYLILSGPGVQNAGKFSHVFTRKNCDKTDSLANDLRETGLKAGDYIIISTDKRLAVDRGNIVDVTATSVTVSANRDLYKRDAQAVFHLDASESNTILVFNLTNLGCLLDRTEAAHCLREVIIDKVVPSFTTPVDKNILRDCQSLLHSLNKGQRQALVKTLEADRYLLIKGMPGTGKTATLVALVQLLVRSGQSVLVTSHTHAAVDNLLLRLKKVGLQFLRLGSDSRIHPELLAYSETALTQTCKTPEDIDKALSMQVVGVTCLGAGHALMARGRVFDVCLVDESTQVLQPSVLRPLFNARRFVLIGDPDQLPPVVRSHQAQELGLSESLFVRLDSREATVSLTYNYRMNRVITDLANGLTYAGELNCGSQRVAESTIHLTKNKVLHQSAWLTAALSSEIEYSVVFVDTSEASDLNTGDITSTEDSTCSNKFEVKLVLECIDALIQNGVSGSEIGVMAPYRSQVSLLSQAVEASPNFVGVEVNTVDQFQGRDKQVVLYSCTRNDGATHRKPKEREILNDKRRLTVAITRAKHKLILVGHVTTLRQYVPFEKLLSCLSEKFVIPVHTK